MKTSIYITLLLLVCFFSCDTKNKKDKTPSEAAMDKMYKDIDPFILAGVDETKDVSYPYIKIIDRDAEKTIVYRITATDSAEQVYRKKPDHWAIAYQPFGDTSRMMYEFIYPDSIIMLDYIRQPGATNIVLRNAAVMKADSIITYSFSDIQKPIIAPGINVIDSVKDKTPLVITEIKEVKDNMLRTTVSHFNKKVNKTTYSDTSCFKGSNRSWLWFRHFIPQLTVCN